VFSRHFICIFFCLFKELSTENRSPIGNNIAQKLITRISVPPDEVTIGFRLLIETKKTNLLKPLFLIYNQKVIVPQKKPANKKPSNN